MLFIHGSHLEKRGMRELLKNIWWGKFYSGVTVFINQVHILVHKRTNEGDIQDIV